MGLFVQLKDKRSEDVWHVVDSFESSDGRASLDIQRTYTCGCGLVETANGSRMAEADVPPWTNRHVAKGCFTTASDPIPTPKQGA
jgi:hypothetical protein